MIYLIDQLKVQLHHRQNHHHHIQMIIFEMDILMHIIRENMPVVAIQVHEVIKV